MPRKFRAETSQWCTCGASMLDAESGLLCDECKDGIGLPSREEAEKELRKDGVDVDGFRERLLRKVYLARLAVIGSELAELHGLPMDQIQDRVLGLIERAHQLKNETLKTRKVNLELYICVYRIAHMVYIASYAPSHLIPPTFDDDLEKQLEMYEHLIVVTGNPVAENTL